MQFEQPKKMPKPDKGKSLLPPGVQAIIFDIDVVKSLEDDYRCEIPAPLEKWHQTKESINWQHNKAIFFVTRNGPEPVKAIFLRLPKLRQNENLCPNL